MIEGRLAINVCRNNSRVEIVEIKSSRPLHASKLLIGKTPQKALEIIPLLFNICGVAQSYNAYYVLNKNDNNRQARKLLVKVETLKEHLLRVFQDTPKLLAVSATKVDLPFVAQLVKQFSALLFKQGKAFELESQAEIDLNKLNTLIEKIELFIEQTLFGIPAAMWLQITNIKPLIKWANETPTIAAKAITIILQNNWGSQGQTEIRALSETSDSEINQLLDSKNADDFIATPSYLNKTAETTALTRQLKHPLIADIMQQQKAGLLARWIARLLEIAEIPQQLRILLAEDSTPKTNKQRSVCQIEAARGRLIHRALVENNRIENYQIIAPTEWNFHPQGVAAQSLKNIKVKSNKEYTDIAHLIINSIDPCVGYQLSVKDA